MLRKLYKLALLPGLLVLGGGSTPTLAQSQPATATNAPASAQEAAIWSATARYVYQDDSELQALLPKLLPTTTATTIEGFKQGINKAVKLEGKKPKDSHVFMFQTQVFQKVQQLAPANTPALAAAIEQELLAKHPERQGKPAFQKFSAEINRLAEPADVAPAGAATTAPDEVAGNPMDQVGVAPATTAPLVTATAALVPTTGPPAGQWLWLSLALSALSLASVAILWNKLSNTRKDLERIRSNWENSSSRNTTGKSFSQTDLAKAVEREVSRQIDSRSTTKQAKPAPSAAPLPPAEPIAPPVAVAQETPPATRLRTQYVGEAPFNNIFPARALSDQPSTYSMFAIESSEDLPDQGTFAVTGNLASHVRDHRTVLEPACEYVGGSPLGSETRVITEQPGVVRRRGNDWEVVQRAKVRFE